MIRVGLTGSIGSGKSTVARLLRERRIPVLDADALAREVSGFPSVLEAVSRAFGPEYLLEGGLNRPRLAELVFANPEARVQLNAIIHPKVREEMARRQAELERAGERLVVQDIPLLFESGLEHVFDATILVDAPLELRIARVMARDGISREQVLARDAAQMPAQDKRQRATFILENGGKVTELEAQLDAVLEQVNLLHTTNTEP